MCIAHNPHRPGLVDLDLITTGQSAAARRRIGDLGKSISELLAKRKARTVTFNVLIKELSEAAGTVWVTIFRA